MTTICLPTPDAAEFVGVLPDDVVVVVWDGTGEPPAGVEGVEFFVGRYDAAPPAASAFDRMPRLRVLQLVSAGVDAWLPVVPEGVLLCNGRGVHGSSTAELAVTGMLAMLRDLPAFIDAQRAGRWQPHVTGGLAAKRVLVIGAGDIGRRIADSIRPFDADVTLVARTARDGVRAAGELPTLLPQADVAVLAVPATPRTDRLVDRGFLAALPDGALVVNIARGRIVDTDALVAEVTTGRLRAFLDVTDPEPLPPGHALWDAPNVLLTPHVGGGTRGWQQRAYGLVRQQIERFVSGEPLANVIERADLS